MQKKKIILAAIALAFALTQGHAAMAYKAASGCTGGTTPSVNTPTSPTLHHPLVQLIFWGSAWDGTSGQWWNSSQPITYGQWIAATQNLVSGPFYSELNQYANIDDENQKRGIAPPRLLPVAPIYNGAFRGGSTFTVCDINQVINAEITAGAVEQPTSLVDMIYVVVLPTGITPGADASEGPNCANYFNSNFIGQHQQCVGGSCPCPGANSTSNATCSNAYTFESVWVEAGGSITASNSATVTLSHELAESITNPTVSQAGGVTVDYPNNCVSTQNCPEIADVCNCNGFNPEETQNGVRVQPYWSAQDGACVIPEGYEATWQYQNSANDWSLITATPMRQLYGGHPTSTSTVDLLGTDSSDDVWEFNATADSWTEISTGSPGPGAYYVMTSSGPWAARPDGRSVMQYNGSSWVNLNFQTVNQQAFPISAMFGGPNPGVIDSTGGVWTYSNSSSTWTLINDAVNNAPDQVVENSFGSIYYLTQDHVHILAYDTANATWYSLANASSAADIFVGGTEDTLGMAQLGTQFPYFRTNGGEFSTTWVQVGVPEVNVASYAMAGSGQLFSLQAGSFQNPIEQANNPTVANDGWTSVAATALKMVGGGSTFFATNYITY